MTRSRGRPTTLTGTQQAQILLLDREGKDYREISRALGIPGGQVLYWIFKNARKELAVLKQHNLKSEADVKTQTF